MKPQKNLPDLSKHKITLHAKRKDILAYFQKHYQINSFDELIDPSDEVDGFPVGEIKAHCHQINLKEFFSEKEKTEYKKHGILLILLK